jgi:hypothetical protein
VDDHEVVDNPVGLEQVAVAVDVALVLDVVVGPGEVGLGGGQGVDRVHHQLADLAGLSGWPTLAWGTWPSGLGAGGALEGPRALAGLGRLGLEHAELLGRRREALGVLAVEGVGLGDHLGAGGERGPGPLAQRAEPFPAPGALQLRRHRVVVAARRGGQTDRPRALAAGAGRGGLADRRRHGHEQGEHDQRDQRPPDRR